MEELKRKQSKQGRCGCVSWPARAAAPPPVKLQCGGVSQVPRSAGAAAPDPRAGEPDRTGNAARVAPPPGSEPDRGPQPLPGRRAPLVLPCAGPPRAAAMVRVNRGAAWQPGREEGSRVWLLLGVGSDGRMGNGEGW